MQSQQSLAEQIQRRRWFHTIDLGGGLVTRGNPPSQLINDHFPKVEGKTVLDIGAWDGKYSFQAEAAGASRVVAMDHYMWRLDVKARNRYYEECRSRGVLPHPETVANGLLLPDGSRQGKEGFDLLHEYLASKVESRVEDFITTDISNLGTFDVVLFFGVLYHVLSPLETLLRLRQVTTELAVIETAAITVPGHDDSGLLRFVAGDELHDDYGNWFLPSPPALVAMCKAAGFRRVDVMGTFDEGPPPTEQPFTDRVKEAVKVVIRRPTLPPRLRHIRLVVYAYS